MFRVKCHVYFARREARKYTGVNHMPITRSLIACIGNY